MPNNKLAVEMEQQLSLLSQNFYQELRKIVEQRLKLEQECLSFGETVSGAGRALIRDTKEVKKPKHFAVRLEPSLGEKLAKSRGTADELEDKLHETRTAFEDKLKTVERMKIELGRRENVLVSSIQQIEAYIRGVFCLKRKADVMYIQLEKVSEQQRVFLKQLEDDHRAEETKKSVILKSINASRSTKLFLEKMVAG